MMIRNAAAAGIGLLMLTTAHAGPAPDCGRPASPAETAACARVDIRTYFRLVPLGVFDTTTDGLEDEAQRALLLDKGESEDWTFRRVSADTAILRARHGNSTVTMSLTKTGPVVLKVHVQNEKAETVTHWTFAGEDKPLRTHAPR